MKKEIDNFEQINRMLIFETNDDYYHLQILKRHKDNPGKMSSNNVLLATYSLKSDGQLMKMKEDIVAICKATNSRAYINLNKKSFKRASLEMLKDLATIISTEQYESQKLFNRATGKTNSATNEKKWILDIDDKDWLKANMEELSLTLERIDPKGDKIIDVIETKAGHHVITSPFNLHLFNIVKEHKDESWGFDIHKNNPTILYVPKS
jgi:hypothetical protein